MSSNPYAPPKSNVDRITQIESAPALWNPDAAMKWSLLFSPVFGALLQMKNWQALGESAKAKVAAGWAAGSLAFILGIGVLAVLLPHSRAFDSAPRVFGLLLLLAWYLLNGRAQGEYVKARFGDGYPRNGWGKPLALALLAIVAFFALLVGFVVVAARMGVRI
jgi:hypothetical protein